MSNKNRLDCQGFQFSGKKRQLLSSGDTIDKMDRISHLPDDVIYHILSFLDVFDALGAGLLSKRWELLCSALPFIDIDIPKLCTQRDLTMSVQLCYKFEQFISWVLSSRSAVNITRLTVRCVRCTDPFRPEQIFRWMCVAARRNVQEFILDIDVSDSNDVFHMPLSLVSGQSLQFFELNLSRQPLQLPSYPGFTCLKTLCLKRIKLINEDLTRSFFSGCPLLKKLVLSIYTFENMRVLDISSSTVEYLSFEDCPGVDDGYAMIDLKISCPKLLAFKYGATMPRKYIFDGVSSLETLHIHPHINENFDSPETVAAACVCVFYGVLKTARKIVDLKLGMYIISGLFQMGNRFRCDRCSFHGLKVLNLWFALVDDEMKIISLLLNSCHNLEDLTLYFEEKDEEITLSEMEDFSKCTCLRSSIKTLQLMSFKGEADEIEFARILLECGLVLKKFVLYWRPERMIDDEVVNMILSFPRSSESVEVVIVDRRLSIDLVGWQSM